MSVDSRRGVVETARGKLAACALAAMFAVGFTSATVSAQDASPEASPTACDAPALPPGTPTPMDMASPEAMEGMDMASPVPAEDEVPVEEASPVAELVGEPADEATTAEATAAVENFVGCLNSGDYEAVAALFTADGLLGEFGLTNPYDVAAEVEGLTFSDLEVLSVLAYEDGTVSADVQYINSFSEYQLNAERWVLVEDEGYWKIDAIDFNAPQIDEDSAVVGVNLTETANDDGTITYAIAPNTETAVENEAIIFHAINAGTEVHELVVIQLPEGADPAGLLDGSVAFEDITFFGAVAPLAPGEEADLTLIGLPAGVYTMLCFFPDPQGVPHAALGMIAQFEVTAAE